MGEIMAYVAIVLDVRVEIQNLHNDAFDVEQVTKRFFDDYAKVYFKLQEGGVYFRASNLNNLVCGASIK
jgi:hypothetical protein